MALEVKKVLLVLSGKGGVGKSTVSAQLALSLEAAGKRVGVLDVDLCGPSIPRMLGLESQDVHQSARGWVPVYTSPERTLAVMSIGFLLDNRNDAVVWRGPKKNAIIKQFMDSVIWEDLDFLVIDTPPGTSDEHIAVVENVKGMSSCAILVTTPQAVAVDDVRRELTFCHKVGIPVLGILENMSGFVCPSCTECTNVFSTGGGEALASLAGVPFLGRIPLDPNLTQCSESGKSFVSAFAESPASRTFCTLVEKIDSFSRT